MPAGLLPCRCEVCEDWGGALVCEPCRSRFVLAGPRCQGCAMRLVETSALRCGHCLQVPPLHEAAHAAVDYGYPWDRLVAALKYRGQVELADVLATLVIGTLSPDQRAWPELLVPVPLAPSRLRERGFNQAWELARRLARRLGADADAGALSRTDGAPPAASLDRAGRLRALKGRFGVPHPDRVRGRRVVLVDDVMTTGATAAAATLALRGAGASAVQVWVLARTP